MEGYLVSENKLKPPAVDRTLIKFQISEVG